jgi:hypothetical protein
MAEKKIAERNRRKRWLSIQSDTLRYQLNRHCAAVDASIGPFARGYSLARAGLILWSAGSPLRGGSHRKWLALPSVFLRFFRATV